MKSELQDGGRELKRLSKIKKAGSDSSDPNSDIAVKGYDAAKSKNPSKRVKEEYKDLTPEERKSYKKGYANGASEVFKE